MTDAGLGYGKIALVDTIIKQHWQTDTPVSLQYKYGDLLFIIQEMLDNEGHKYIADEASSRSHGHHRFRDFVDFLLMRNLCNFDSMILLTGLKGFGKSSFCLSLARRWYKIIGKKADTKTYFVYSNAQLMHAIDTLPPFSVIICDEAVNFALASNWAKTENKELIKKLAQVRTKHFLFVLCFPLKITKVHGPYLESYVNYWIDLYARGRSAIYIKDSNPYNDPWRLKEFQRIGSYNEFTDPERIEKMLKKHPNFWQMMKYPKPSKRVYEEYVEIREKNVWDQQHIAETITPQDIHRALLICAFDEIMRVDPSVTPNIIIALLKKRHDVTLPRASMDYVIQDAKQILQKVKEQSFEVKE